MTDDDIDRLLRETLRRRTHGRRVPVSTYRLQFHKGFSFRDATAIVPYLSELGITHVYASPYLKATPGSTHGYDVVDHTRLNDELGTQGDYDEFVSTLAAHGMSHILDTVPNHMGIATNENHRWNELLASGRDGPAGRFFDIAWDESPRPELSRKVLLPVLGEPYGDALEKGKLKLERRDGRVVVTYYDRQFPIKKPVGDLDRYSTNDESGVNALDELLERQHYRLACWKTASDEINYRRFFDVTGLAALAIERDEVFDDAHALTLSLIAKGHVSGLRVDHSDGLLDPAAYFLRLQRETLVACALSDIDSSEAGLRERLRDRVKAIVPDTHRGPWPLYLITEKILAPGEPLPRWAIDGTSGYDILNELNGIFISARGAEKLHEIYRLLVPSADVDYEELAFEKKHQTLRNGFASELALLTRQLDRIAQADRRTRDFTFVRLEEALAVAISSFDVYRTYVTANGPSDRDATVIDQALTRSRKRSAALDAGLFDLIGNVLLLRGRYAQDLRSHALRFAEKFQQLTSPVTAKGLEDCAFYIHHRLISVNEVGGEPTRAGIGPETLHEYLSLRQREWPAAMTVLSTHDTKRGEDVRARINALSELPEEWSVVASEGMKYLEELHPNDAYLLLQTFAGTWPHEATGKPSGQTYCERITAYMLKALREAKVRTSWTRPNEAVESTMRDVIHRLLQTESGKAFRDQFEPFALRIARIGRLNALSQTTLRLAAPGVPDTYQGTELWDDSLVDPDNRRPVDYEVRSKLLRSLNVNSAIEVFAAPEDGRCKLMITATLLRARREWPSLFIDGTYEPVRIEGPLSEHLFAFTRTHGTQQLLVAVPRLIAKELQSDGTVRWAQTRLTVVGRWLNLMTQQEVDAGELDTMLGGLPVGVWIRT